MSYKQFQHYVKESYNRIPITREFLCDSETALNLYLKVANAPYTYLLESMQGGEKWGRYSFIGLPCRERICVKNNILTLTENNNVKKQIKNQDPLDWIKNYYQQFRAVPLKGMPRFSGGLVGYFGYDTIRFIEPRLNTAHQRDFLDVPDILLLLSEEIIIYDNVNNRINLVIYVDPSRPNAYEQGLHDIEVLQQKIMTAQLCDNNIPLVDIKQSASEFSSNMTKEEYQLKIEKALHYFNDGDAMQLILSQRFQKPYYAQPINFYRALRCLNPSPYMFHFNFDDFYVVGASPEILVRLEDNQITLRPLAGTRPRGKTEPEDLQLEQELLSDPKELAEHLMLIDLGRNDVGRVSQVGTVKVTEQMIIERYSHVMHISSNVVGTLAPNLNAFDVLRATFPAGTVSGTPKVRAMEIIDELEEDKRAIYGGAVGYLAWNGNMDMALALRTAVIKNNMITVQTGAGIVIDSKPENEWQECINKAKALFRASEIANN